MSDRGSVNLELRCRCGESITVTSAVSASGDYLRRFIEDWTSAWRHRHANCTAPQTMTVYRDKDAGLTVCCAKDLPGVDRTRQEGAEWICSTCLTRWKWLARRVGWTRVPV